MPASRLKPEDTFADFHTEETFTSVATRLGVVRLTLKRWWIREFGEEAFRQRVNRTKTPEEKRQTRRAHREVNKDRINDQKRAWAQANSHKVRAARQVYLESHREQHKAYCKMYYAANAQEFRERARQYRAANNEQVRRKERDFYVAHPERLLLKGARQRANRFGLPFDISVADILKVLPKDGCCPITGEPFERGVGKVGPRSMTLDRIIPSLGYVPGNIAVISHLANTIKQNCTDPEVFRRMAQYLDQRSI